MFSSLITNEVHVDAVSLLTDSSLLTSLINGNALMAICLTILNFFLNFWISFLLSKHASHMQNPKSKQLQNLKEVFAFLAMNTIWNMRKTLCKASICANERESIRSWHCSTLLVAVNSRSSHWKIFHRDIKNNKLCTRVSREYTSLLLGRTPISVWKLLRIFL